MQHYYPVPAPNPKRKKKERSGQKKAQIKPNKTFSILSDHFQFLLKALVVSIFNLIHTATI